METEFINLIREKTTTKRWCNNTAGHFKYDSINYLYRFVATTKDLYCYLYPEREWNDENTPAVIKGFIAFLIACWGLNEIAIYQTYNERKKNQFFDIEEQKPGSFKRDLNKEFAKQFIEAETSYIEEFKANFDYISDEEKTLLLEYAKNYLEYTADSFKLKLITPKEDRSFESLLHHDNKSKLIGVLHSLLDDTQGKKVAIVIKALIELGFIDLPSNRNELYRLMINEFGNIGTTSNLNNYLNPDSRKLLDTDLTSTMEILKRI